MTISKESSSKQDGGNLPTRRRWQVPVVAPSQKNVFRIDGRVRQTVRVQRAQPVGDGLGHAPRRVRLQNTNKGVPQPSQHRPQVHIEARVEELDEIGPKAHVQGRQDVGVGRHRRRGRHLDEGGFPPPAVLAQIENLGHDAGLRRPEHFLEVAPGLEECHQRPRR